MRLRSDHTRGVLMVLIAIFVLSPDALILRLVGTDRWSLIFWRGLLTALTLLICFVAIYRRDVFKYLGAIGRYGLVAGFISATSSILFVTSIVLTSVANTLVIISAAPLFTAISSRMFLREPVPARTWLAIFATLVGITTIFSGSLGGRHAAGRFLCPRRRYRHRRPFDNCATRTPRQYGTDDSPGWSHRRARGPAAGDTNLYRCSGFSI